MWLTRRVIQDLAFRTKEQLCQMDCLFDGCNTIPTNKSILSLNISRSVLRELVPTVAGTCIAAAQFLIALDWAY